MAVTETQIMEALKQVIDPELGIDIVALGLIYEVLINGSDITIRMTLTTPGCPLAPVIDQMIQEKIGAVDGVSKVSLDLVWDPPWTPQMMSDDVRAEFGFD